MSVDRRMLLQRHEVKEGGLDSLLSALSAVLFSDIFRLCRACTHHSWRGNYNRWNSGTRVLSGRQTRRREARVVPTQALQEGRIHNRWTDWRQIPVSDLFSVLHTGEAGFRFQV